MIIRTVLVIASLLLMACSSESSVSESPVPKQGPAQKTHLEKTISTQLDTLDNAKAVEQKLQDDAEKRKAQIDAQGG